MEQDTEFPSAPVVMPLGELHGRPVWTEAGERIGVVRGVEQDDDGRIVSLEVRERWMLGPIHEIPATGMRIDQGDIIVPASIGLVDAEVAERAGDAVDRRSERDLAHAPVLLAGREGARSRFGGLDLVGSMFGALVAIACLVLFGGVLSAIFGSDAATVDTSLTTFGAVTSESMLVGGATIFLASFVGGWAAGRSARFDGVANGLLTVAWVLAIGLVLAAAGRWLGNDYDVLAASDAPRVATDGFAVWGSVAFVAALVLMLLGGALGGALGESWHRRADRTMLDVVTVDEGAQADAVFPPGRAGHRES